MTKTGPIAVIGGGVAGLVSAWLLAERYPVALFERNSYPGGHTCTVEVPGPEGTMAVDTGFIVYNAPNYPRLTRLLAHLNVETRATDMSFAFSADEGRYEWAGDNLATLFAQRRNLFDPAHWRLLWNILRFNCAAQALLEQPDPALTVAQFLSREKLHPSLGERYLLPMAAAIWSCPKETMKSYPAVSLCRFFRNHGLLSLTDRPQWRTVAGGAQRYVKRLLATRPIQIRLNEPVRAVTKTNDGWRVRTDATEGLFSQVVLSCHADEAASVLEGAPQTVYDCLAAFRYQENTAWLHRDDSLMPRRRKVWSSWNYLSHGAGERVSVTYWMNRLQHLPGDSPVFVSLNPPRPPAEDKTYQRRIWHHPVFDHRAIGAQERFSGLQGVDGLWLAGSYTGYGFHEDAVASATAIAACLGVLPDWLEGL